LIQVQVHRRYRKGAEQVVEFANLLSSAKDSYTTILSLRSSWCHSRARVWRARGGSCRPERSEGTTAAPRPFTEFTLSEAEGFRAAASGRPESGARAGQKDRDSSRGSHARE